MKVRELLKSYRLSQAKTKKSWAGNVISPSYYARIENGTSRVSAEDLIKLLKHNQVSLPEFFDRFKEKEQNDTKEITNLINQAYYNGSKEDIIKIRNKVLIGDLPNKKEVLLLTDVALALVKNDFDSLDSTQVKALKDRFFNLEEIDEESIALYGNCMAWFDFTSNLVISKKIVQRFIESDDNKTKNQVLQVIINMLFFCIEKKQYDDSIFFIKKAKKIVTVPGNFFYKNILNFSINLIEFHYDSRESHIELCQAIIKNLSVNGMIEYSLELEQFLERNKRKLEE